MDRLGLLKGETPYEDQVLETDIMRFMGIVGMVFWIIFAMIKSIPFRHDSLTPNQPPQELRLPDLRSHPVLAFPPENKTTGAALNGPQTLPVPGPEIRSFSPTARPATVASNPVADQPRSLAVRIQFESLEDLLTLITNKEVRVFCRARAKGFDLFFEGLSQRGQLSFKGTADQPVKMWEIKSGKGRQFFLNILIGTYPALSSFPTREIFVSFVDKGLEEQVEETLGRLQAEGKSGVLSISRFAGLAFDDFGKEHRSDNPMNPEGGTK